MKWLKNLLSRRYPSPAFDQIPLKKMKEPSTTSPTGTTPLYSDPTTAPSGSVSTIIAGTTRPLALEPGKVYELTVAQYAHLWNAANREGMVFQVPSPAFNDQPQHARDLLQLCQEFEDLMALELVVDVSQHYQENVAEAWDEQGRHVRFMAITKLAQLMFEENGKRPVN